MYSSTKHKQNAMWNQRRLLTLSGERRPATIFSIVDFPVPEGPITPTASPCLIYTNKNESGIKILLKMIKITKHRNRDKADRRAVRIIYFYCLW